ncbi:hypothetical protein Hdeb2414_s0007g00254151 [Helianthus debilis subsp. tardiflorus]
MALQWCVRVMVESDGEGDGRGGVWSMVVTMCEHGAWCRCRWSRSRRIRLALGYLEWFNHLRSDHRGLFVASLCYKA